jgi:ribonuclease R
MILANVCAAETLEARGVPTLYRVHDRPPPERLAALAEFLKPRGLSFARGQVPMARQFADLLDRVRASPDAAVIQETVLRTQAQAVYQPDNIGHFGLALRRYAHFTSPIRRYADLVVHRALIAALDLGADGLSPDIGELAAIGGEVSATERRAATAEREVVDRFVAAWFEGRRGEGFAATVSGVGGFGLFVRLAESGAEGLVPMRRLPGDYWEFDEAARRLVGARSGWAMTLGDLVTVRLSEVDVTTGSLTFDFVDGGRPVTNSGPAAGRRARGRR